MTTKQVKDYVLLQVYVPLKYQNISDTESVIITIKKTQNVRLVMNPNPIIIF